MKPERAEVSAVMQELSAYIATAIKKPLPRDVAERAKLHLVDTFAAMVSGSRLLPGRKALAYMKALGGTPEAGVIGSRIVTTAANAALGNGMLANADETDDSHPPSYSHPGASSLAAGLAIGERDRLPGAAVLRAIVLGYDITARILLSIDAHFLRRSGHQATAFGAVFSAAAVAGALLKLNPREVRFLLSYAAQQAAGLYCTHRDTEHVEKAFVGSGMGAHNGTAAALMVAHGFTGVEDVFSGERDFFFTFAPEADRTQLTRGRGRDYEVMRCAIKRWPAGGPIQSPLYVLHELIQEHGFKAKDVEKIVLTMPEKDVHGVNNREMPDDCVQHLLAVMMLDGTLTFKSSHDFARMKDPKVLAIRKRMKVVGDPKLNDALRRWRGRIDITLKSGRKLAHQTMSAKGGFEYPLSREEEEKALDLMVPVLGKRRAQALIATLWDFDRITDVRSLRKLVSV